MTQATSRKVNRRLWMLENGLPASNRHPSKQVKTFGPNERQHFVLNYGEEAFNAMVDLAVSFCRSQNYRFDTDRFRGYIAGTCGPNGGEIKRKAA